MKNLKYKKASIGIIVLFSSIAFYYILVFLINIFFQFSEVRSRWKGYYSFAVDVKDQKFLLINLYNENKVEVYDLEKHLLRTEEINHRVDNKAAKKFLDWSDCFSSPNNISSQLSTSCINIWQHYGDWGVERWYYLPKKKYFIGYSNASSRIIGYIGANGFSINVHEIQIFNDVQFISNIAKDYCAMTSDGEAYIIQLSTRKIISLHREQNEKIILIDAQFEFEGDKYNELPKGFIVSTKQRVMTYTSDGKIESSALFPSSITLQKLDRYLFNGKHYLYARKGDEKSRHVEFIIEFSANGDVLWNYEFNEVAPNKGLTLLEYNHMAIPFFGRLAVNCLNKFYEVDTFGESSNPLRDTEFRKIGDINLSFLITLLILPFGLIFVYFHLNKRTDSKFKIYSWLMITLIFSIPGVIAYLMYHRHAKTVVCTHCGKKFLPIKNTCLICSKEIPLTKPDGREIFTVI